LGLLVGRSAQAGRRLAASKAAKKTILGKYFEKQLPA
jgi:hypothetical protein